MKVQCAWCDDPMPYGPGESGKTSHGICGRCLAEQEAMIPCQRPETVMELEAAYKAGRDAYLSGQEVTEIMRPDEAAEWDRGWKDAARECGPSNEPENGQVAIPLDIMPPSSRTECDRGYGFGPRE